MLSSAKEVIMICQKLTCQCCRRTPNCAVGCKKITSFPPTKLFPFFMVSWPFLGSLVLGIYANCGKNVKGKYIFVQIWPHVDNTVHQLTVVTWMWPLIISLLGQKSTFVRELCDWMKDMQGDLWCSSKLLFNQRQIGTIDVRLHITVLVAWMQKLLSKSISRSFAMIMTLMTKECIFYGSWITFFSSSSSPWT